MFDFLYRFQVGRRDRLARNTIIVVVKPVDQKVVAARPQAVYRKALSVGQIIARRPLRFRAVSIRDQSGFP